MSTYPNPDRKEYQTDGRDLLSTRKDAADRLPTRSSDRLKSLFLPSSPTFKHLASHCADVKPITAFEFLTRQQSLAEALHVLNASAYIAEPGANAQFFGNISTGTWFLSERPLLLIITPDSESNGSVNPRVSILTPSFEATRARLLAVPAQGNVSFFEWPEDVNPYEIAVSALSDRTGPIYIDGGMRKFIADGLASALPNNTVLSAPLEIRSLRERKSPAEIELLRCASEVTLLAIRAVREELRIGMTESEARRLMTSALSDADLSDPFVLGLFGENAALPHGSGSDRVLGKEDYILFDTGGILHGYHSDITRTFALKESTIPTDHLEVWFTVHAAQSAALRAARNGSLTRRVDEAARTVISTAGYGKFFTHRLGHGIGLEVHEAPYLRGGSSDIIRPGHVFTDEPGIYIEGKVGVRHEDAFYVSEDGTSVLLTAGVGGQASSPWRP
ncbi:Creatinase/aminopeptidase [Fomitiporia mediterranea MF3/22]|uniref:Creatinase/aminopeptidase n=1 Tax=Fomitiporia mediterranea (strain MF3/22) TaxID=694068 RepID=UPI0004407D62|nr:Creatinase/aminopeptidase [Fomitiporia mediterranea MF3/22]EJD05791.1 Creatinase/aminopeptidase [Fomitiporia mediterranea MF3/22]